jgi:hypothetical protein
LEAWFLADAAAINGVLVGVGYVAPAETGNIAAGTRLRGLWQLRYPTAAFNKIDFAKTIAPKFAPNVAAKHSKSFDHCWKRFGQSVK